MPGTTKTPNKNWFGKHLALTIWGGLIIFGVIVSAFDGSGAANQKAHIYEPQPTPSFRVLATPTPYAPAYQAPTYYNTGGSSYKYNSRSGYSGSYEYNYDVNGYGGEDGNYYYGNVDISSDGGEGYLYDEDGNEIWVEGEWDSYGEIEAYDEDGNSYELEID